ncbi:MAG: type IV pilus assembly protein PilA [Arenicella sp.]|jgi:type IV pilus assembly protein PilA
MQFIKIKAKQFGQGMTEYIIIVALIAIAAIAVYGFFGDTIRAQMGGITKELSGKDGTTSVTAAATASTSAAKEGAAIKKLDSYQDDAK